MSDTMRANKSRVLVVLVTISSIIAGLPSSLSRTTSREPSGGSAGIVKAGTGSNRLAAIVAAPVQATPGYDLLLQDSSSGDMLRWNSTTGDYRYSRCTDGFSLTGTGSVTSHGSTYTLSHFPADRRVTATLDNGLHSGTASVQYPIGSTTYTIADKSSIPNPGATDSAPPEAGLSAPNGGEIVDTNSSFVIAWESTDDVGIASHDLSFSTDGGSTYSNIVTGLAGNLNQYSWSVPLMVNKKTVRVRVVARDAGCNVSRDESNGDFTVWNPPASFTHSAEAPLFFSGQGYTSTVYMTNTSSNALVVELDPHQPDGNATQNFPFQTLLNAGASATVKTESLYTIGASPENPDVPEMIDGGIRLRHNGSQDNDVRAIIVVERDCSEEFTTPFTYAAFSLSASGTMQCSPMYYVDDDTDAFVAFQNVTNSAQTVQLTCHYGTGVSGTPNGEFKNQPITLGPQKTHVVNLRSVLGALGGAEWGSMTVFTSAPQSVVCHSVMRSLEKGISWDAPFVDPAMSTNTTKVAQAVRLDHNNNENAYVMVCNMSTASRTVTASFNTNNGITLPPVQVTIAPGGQQMISVKAREILKPGISTLADVRLTYAGSPSDIAAGGCSMTANQDRAIAVKFKEASVNDGRRLTSPYFRFDEYISGRMLVSNLGSSSIKVGAKMVLANSTVKPLKTPAVTIPAGGMATIDLSSVGDSVPDNVIATGRVDLIHSGPAGTVTAAVTESGCYNSAQVVPLDGGVPLDPVTLFPIRAVVIPGGCTEAEAITDGTISNPEFVAGGCFATLIQTFASGPNTFQTRMCVPTTCVGDIGLAYVPPGGGGGGDESDFSVVQITAAGFSTSLGTRLNPNGTTQFTLTAQSAFPNALLQVEFTGTGGSVSTQVQGNGVSTSITGTGPVNHTFLGKVKKIFVTQLNSDGTPNTSVPRVLKAKNTGAYFALDKPTSITSVAPAAVPVTGGTVTITGTGIQPWTLTNGPDVVTVNPIVLIGKANRHDQIPFTVIVVDSATTLRGNVGRTPNEIGTCADVGETPCKTITVINPGGSDGVDNLTSEKLLTINSPAAPVINGTAALTAGSTGPPTSNSIGMQNIRVVGGFTAASPVSARITGRNLGRVGTVTFAGAAPVAIGPSNINSAGTQIDVGVPAFCITGAGGSNTVAVTVDDGVNPLVSFANGWIYTATGPIQIFIPGVSAPAIAFLAGPCEDVMVNYTPSLGNRAWTGCNFVAASCITIDPRLDQHGVESILFPNANIAVFRPRESCSGCSPGSHTGAFPANAINSKSMSQVSLCVPVSCSN